MSEWKGGMCVLRFEGEERCERQSTALKKSRSLRHCIEIDSYRILLACLAG